MLLAGHKHTVSNSVFSVSSYILVLRLTGETCFTTTGFTCSPGAQTAHRAQTASYNSSKSLNSYNNSLQSSKSSKFLSLIQKVQSSKSDVAHKSATSKGVTPFQILIIFQLNKNNTCCLVTGFFQVKPVKSAISILLKKSVIVKRVTSSTLI